MTDPSPPTELSVDAPTGGGQRPRSIALIAAVVLVVVAGAVAAAFALGGDDDDPTLGSETPAAGADRLWGNRYQVVSTVAKTGAEPWTPPSDPALTMTFDVDRRVSFTGCNGGSGTAAPAAEGDAARLVVDQVMSTQMACVDGDGKALMDHDAWLAGVLQGGVAVEGSTDAPVLRGAEGAEVRLRLLGPAPEPPAPVEDPDAPVTNENPASIDPTQLPPDAADEPVEPVDPTAIDPTQLEPGAEPGADAPVTDDPGTVDPAGIEESMLDPEQPQP
jgi:heat shock protein HslJ